MYVTPCVLDVLGISWQRILSLVLVVCVTHGRQLPVPIFFKIFCSDPLEVFAPEVFGVSATFSCWPFCELNFTCLVKNNYFKGGLQCLAELM